MSEPLISVIIPIYKVEKYLNECLDSIVNQTYQNFEAILINDGSPDKSVDIAQGYVDKDTRFKLFSQINRGLSSARNRGIRESHGEYILFVDSDDYIELDAIENFVKIINQYGEKDVIQGKLVSFDDLNPICVDQSFMLKEITNEQLINLSGIDFMILSGNENMMPGVPFTLFRKQFLLDNELSFVEGIYYEDLEILFRIFIKAKKVGVLNERFYHYRVRKNSIITSSATQKKVESFLKCLETLFEVINELERCEAKNVVLEKITFTLPALYRNYLNSKISNPCLRTQMDIYLTKTLFSPIPFKRKLTLYALKYLPLRLSMFIIDFRSFVFKHGRM